MSSSLRDRAATGCPLSLDALRALRERWREADRRMVLTNGCFDLLHVGHVRYLRAARALGDRLVVAVNDDGSVRTLKGPARPIQPADERAEILCALRSVDAVVIFGGTTASEVVRALAPDVYAKGGDYDAGDRRPPEADEARRMGAEIVYLPLVHGRSTSDVIERIRTTGR